MKEFVRKHLKKIAILASDLMCLAVALICKPLSASLLQKAGNVCIWDAMGFRCLTCGGTHFVNDLLSGRIGAAFTDNQLMFFIAVYLLLSLIVLNLYLLFDLTFAKKMLRWMYNIPVLIGWGVILIAFLLWRNLPVMMDMIAQLSAVS